MANRDDDPSISRQARVRAVKRGQRTLDGNTVADELEAARREEEVRVARRIRGEESPSELLDTLLEECPEPFRWWLRLCVGEQSRESSGYTESFLSGVRRLGLVRAVLSEMVLDDPTPKENRRGEGNYLPDSRIAFPAILHALANETDESWRAIAAKSVTRYAPTPAEAIQVLTDVLARGGEPSFHAATCLAELAPGTPGLVSHLLEALKHDWCASRRRSYHDGTTGADVAAEMIFQLHSALPMDDDEARNAMSALGDCNARTVLGLWFRFGNGDGSLLRSMLATKDGTMREMNGRMRNLVESFAESPHVPRACAEVLRFQSHSVGYVENARWAVNVVVESDLGAAAVLPALAGTSEGLGGDSEVGNNGLRRFLERIEERRGAWDAEDEWIASLRGRAADDMIWLVYADWLEESNDPRATWVRLRHTAAERGESIPEPEPPLSRGWMAVYDAIRSNVSAH